jgi:hypothetical protein
MNFSVCYAAGEWEVCGDRFYEKHELYTMSWMDVKLEHMRSVCVLYGIPCFCVGLHVLSAGTAIDTFQKDNTEDVHQHVCKHIL